MNEIVIAGLIVWVAMAIPSIAHGVVKARRAGRSPGLAVILCLLLPWLGLVFLPSRRGTRRVAGLGYYCAWMFVVAAVMAIISIFLPWVTGDPQLLGEDGHGPFNFVPVAVLVGIWAIALIAGAIGIKQGGDLAAGVGIGITVSLLGGLLVALTYLWGSAGVIVPELRDMQDQIDGRIEIGPGGWIAVVALVVAYLCVTLLPFGLRFDPDPEVPQTDPALEGQQWAEHPQHGDAQYGQPQHGQQQWPQQQPPAQQWHQGGAGW